MSSILKGLNEGRNYGRDSWDSNMPGYQGDYGGAKNFGRRNREWDEDDRIDARIRAEYEKKKEYEQNGTFWLKLKDSQRHLPAGPFIGKQAANTAAIELLKQQPELKGNLLITAYGPDETQGVAEAEIDRPGMKDGRPYSDPYRRHTGNSSYMTPEYLIQKYKERLAQIAAGPYKRPKEVAQLQSRIAKLEKKGVAEGQLDELSPQTLASYKKKAGADATQADKRGDYSRGNKRMSGIMQATRKEFDNDSKNVKEGEELDENLHKWFKEKWVRFGPDGKIRGDCARGDDSEGKPKCLPQSKAQNLGKKGRASAAARKRREDPNPERSGKAINVNTKKKSNEGVAETINTAVLNKRFRHTQVIGDYTYKASSEFEESHDKVFLYIRAYDGTKQIGETMFEIWDFDDEPSIDYLESGGTEVDPAYRNKGIASTMYAYAKMLGNDIRPSDNQRPDGKAMWAAWQKSGAAKHLTGVAEQELDEACWKGYHKEGNKKMFGKTYPNCVKNTNEEQEQHSESCPHCGGEMVSEELMNEKKDACYYKVKSRYKVWPSAYASGALVKCRKSGADSWGNGGKKNESIEEGDVVQFPKKHKSDLEDTHSCVKCGSDLQGGTYMGHKVKVCMPCKQVYLPPNTGIDKRGNKIDEQDISEEQLDEKWTKKYKDSINCSNPKGFSQKAHCAGKQKNESAIMKGLK